MDIEKDSNREAFEAIPRNARALRGAKFKDGEYVALSLFDESSKELAAQLNYGWEVWLLAKAQAIPEGFVVVPKELSDEKANKMAKDEFSKISSLFHMEHRSEPDNSVEQLKRMWIANKIRNLKLFHKLFIGAQEPTND